jgi:hypothetical protein
MIGVHVRVSALALREYGGAPAAPPDETVEITAPAALAEFEEGVDDVAFTVTTTGTADGVTLLVSPTGAPSAEIVLAEGPPGTWTGTLPRTDIVANGSLDRTVTLVALADYAGFEVASDPVDIVVTPFATAPTVAIVGTLAGTAGQYLAFDYEAESLDARWPVDSVLVEVNEGSGWVTVETGVQPDPGNPANALQLSLEALRAIPLALAGGTYQVGLTATIGALSSGRQTFSFTPAAADYLAEVDTWLTAITAAGSSVNSNEAIAAVDRWLRRQDAAGILDGWVDIGIFVGTAWVPSGHYPWFRRATGFTAALSGLNFNSVNDHHAGKGVAASASGAEWLTTDLNLASYAAAPAVGWNPLRNTTAALILGGRAAGTLRSAPFYNLQTGNNLDMRSVRVAGPPETVAFRQRSPNTDYTEPASSDLTAQGKVIATNTFGAAVNELALRRGGIDNIQTGASNQAHTLESVTTKLNDGTPWFWTAFFLGPALSAGQSLTWRDYAQQFVSELNSVYGL